MERIISHYKFSILIIYTPESNRDTIDSMVKPRTRLILKEIKQVLDHVDEKQAIDFINVILSARRIVVCGAGRVGIATSAFGMRLSQLGLSAFSIGDSNVPSIGKRDVLLTASGSGETQTIIDITSRAKQNEVKIALITASPKSKLAQMADCILILNSPTKYSDHKSIETKQPMTALNEQCLWIFYDSLVLELMEIMGETSQSMWARHSTLE